MRFFFLAIFLLLLLGTVRTVTAACDFQDTTDAKRLLRKTYVRLMVDDDDSEIRPIYLKTKEFLISTLDKCGHLDEAREALSMALDDVTERYELLRMTDFDDLPPPPCGRWRWR